MSSKQITRYCVARLSVISHLRLFATTLLLFFMYSITGQNCNTGTIIGATGQTTFASTVTAQLAQSAFTIKGILVFNIGNTQLYGKTITMEAGSQIMVGQPTTSGATLDIDQNTTIVGCNAMWKGIKVFPNNSIWVWSATIEDAEHAIFTEPYVGFVDVRNATFKRNYYGMFIKGSPNPLIVKATTFDGGGSLKPAYSGQSNYSSTPNNFFGISGNTTAGTIDGSGGLNSTVLTNNFKKLRIGIASNQSNLIIQNCTFADMQLAGVYGLNGVHSIANCNFTRCYQGFSDSNGSSNIANNGFDNVSDGINIFASSSTITSNYFNNALNGIVISNTNLANTYKNASSVNGNTLTSCGIGIKVLENNTSANSNHTIDNNTILIPLQVAPIYGSQTANLRGINISGTKNATIRKNTISNDAAFTLNGGYMCIAVNGAANPTITLNNLSITGTPPNGNDAIYYSGISIDATSAATVSCNIIKAFNDGILVNNACLNSQIIANNFSTFQNGYHGIHYETNAVTGVQTHKGNRWFVGTPFVTGAVHLGTGPIATQSRYLVDGNANALLMPTFMSNDPIWFKNEVAPNGTANCNALPLLVSVADNDIEHQEVFTRGATLEELITDESLPFDKHNETGNYMLGRQLLASVHQKNEKDAPKWKDLMTKKANMPVSTFAQMEADVDAFDKSHKKEQDKMNGTLKEMYGLLNEIYIFSKEPIKDKVNYVIPVASKQALEKLQSRREDLEKDRTQYKAAFLKQMQQHKDKTDKLPNTNKVAEVNEREVTTATVQYLLNGTDNLDDATLTKLKSIAAQCPDAGGASVYHARAMVSKFTQSPMYNDDKLCDRPITHLPKSKISDMEVEERGINATPIVYPNPATNEFYVNTTDLLEKPTTIILYNSLGEKILSQQIDEQNPIHKISIPTTVSGLYFLSIMKNDNVIHSEKLFIK